MYYRLGIWHIDFIMKLRTGDNCHGWLTTIPWMATHHPKDKVGHLSALGWSPIIKNHLPKYCRPASQGWLPIIPSMVTHHPKLLKQISLIITTPPTWESRDAAWNCFTHINFWHPYLKVTGNNSFWPTYKQHIKLRFGTFWTGKN